MKTTVLFSSSSFLLIFGGMLSNWRTLGLKNFDPAYTVLRMYPYTKYRLDVL
jgi:hypothetical protein